VAIVTGASRGMGRRMAAALVQAGARVALLARPSDELEQAASALGDAAMPLACDVADPGAVRAAVARTAEAFGRLDVLVNNAAMSGLHLIEEATDEEITREVAVNLLGPIYAMREAIPHMKTAGGGDIVNVSSESVRFPYPYLSLYAATKAGLEMLSTGLRAEVRAAGIRVTILRSGGVADSTMSRSWPADRREAFYKAAKASGNLAMTGGFVPPETMARTLVDVLSLPRELNVDLIEARSL
jgi:NAD(P)-dependent dehydrogenase (short-subunit alcohol dehydrogenase family)